MAAQVNVTLADGETIEFRLSEADLKAFASIEAAREWLAEEFANCGCEPSNPVGKVLLIDRILGIAKMTGDARFRDPTALTRQYLSAVSRALDKPVVSVDLAQMSVGY